jgi:hypothetical protein
MTTLAASIAQPNDPTSDDAPRRVGYLLGAGATQGAASYAGSTTRLVMEGIINSLLEHTHKVYSKDFSDHAGLSHLINEVVDAKTDFEHLLTFLSDTPSKTYQDFANSLKEVFSVVLREALATVEQQIGDKSLSLYGALLDMHAVAGSGERLTGVLTLNYDTFLERSIEELLGRPVNFGVHVGGSREADAAEAVTVLKLHGSFGWSHQWPISASDDIDVALWIPPGIRKAKTDYPFNAIWGTARELLDCDVLRIIGCKLGPNDWDLVSLLFTTMHGRDSAQPYKIEVIGSPADASRIAAAFPYFEVCSMLELPYVGAELIGELLGTEPIEFSALDDSDRKRTEGIAAVKIKNPFLDWLRVKGELMYRDLGTIDTERHIFMQFVEEAI